NRRRDMQEHLVGPLVETGTVFERIARRGAIRRVHHPASRHRLVGEPIGEGQLRGSSRAFHLHIRWKWVCGRRGTTPHRTNQERRRNRCAEEAPHERRPPFKSFTHALTLLASN